uniref:THAP-type domain-containing protein n=1 Tax=Strongyloides venezuelensis TaxID=75913 RepID=A0A0K0FW01_STRVS
MQYKICNIKHSEVNNDHFWSSVKLSAPHLHSLYQKLRIIKSTSIKSESAFLTLSYIRNCQRINFTKGKCYWFNGSILKSNPKATDPGSKILSTRPCLFVELVIVIFEL